MNKIVKFNKNPYFDDYNSDKGFYKILFKENTELQTRELNQLQTILKEQIARFGSSVFKEGSIVTGCESKFNRSVFSAILDENFTFTRVSSFLQQFNNSVLQTSDGKSKVQVSFVVIKDSINQKPLIIFSSLSGETIKPDDVLVRLNSDEIPDTNFSIKVSSEKTAISPASTVMFQSGILFLNGMFVYVPEQKIIIDSFSSTPTASVGFEIEDKIVSFKEDFSLLDNSFYENKQFNNPNEQGADRFVKIAVLSFRTILENNNFAEQSKLENFYEFLRIKSGKVIKNVSTTIYSDIEAELARRTFDESGNFTTKPFTVKVVDHVKGDQSKFSLEISPGKAYVLGYEFDSIATRNIDLDKTLDFETKETYALSTYYGSYIKLQDVSGFFDVQANQKIDLFKVNKSQIVSFTSRQLNKIGTANCRFLRKIGTSFWLYIYNVTLTNGSFSDILSVGVSDQLTVDHGLANLSESKIFDPTNDKLIFQFPEDEIKTINNSTYTVQKCFRSKRFSKEDDSSTILSTVLKLETSSEEFLPSINNFIIFSESGEELLLDSVEVLDDVQRFVRLNVTASEEFNANILALVSVNNGIENVFVEKELLIEKNGLTSGWKQSLENVFIGAKIVSVYEKNNQENVFTTSFQLDRLETNYYYSPFTISYVGKSDLTHSLIIKISYLETSFSGFFCVDSWYNIDYYDIELSKGLFVQRDNVIDFRPAKNLDGTILNAVCPSPTSAFISSYDYYLSRIDKLVVNSSKDFEIIKGIPAKSPNVPLDKESAMTLYTLTIPPNCKAKDTILLKFHQNRNYTMRDIGKLEQRISNLEYYTSLTLLEQDTESLEIKDELGNSRFKNGFLVDNFKNFKSLDYLNVDNSCSFDLVKGHLRPKFNLFNRKATFVESQSQLIRIEDMVLLPYTEIPFIQQLQCSDVINLQPFEVFSWEGKVSISPETDEWVDTSTSPTITINQFGEKDVWSDIGAQAFKTEWGSWDSKITKLGADTPLIGSEVGSFANMTTEESRILWNPTVSATVGSKYLDNYRKWVESGFTKWLPQTKPDGFVNGQPAIYLPIKIESQDKTRVGSQTAFTASEVITNSIGTAVTDIGLVPFMQEININFSAKNLKPNTQVYVFFDGKNVTNFCSQDNVDLFTDNKGSISGVFYCPKGVFSIGPRIFRISDSKNDVESEITTSCSTKFTSNGLSQNKAETYLSTREPKLTKIVKTETTSETVFAWGNLPVLITPTPTPTLTPTPTHSVTPSITPSITPTISLTPTRTPPVSPYPSQTPWPSSIPGASQTPQPSPYPSQTPWPSSDPIASQTPAPSPYPSSNPIASQTPWPSSIPGVSQTPQPSPTPTKSRIPYVSQTPYPSQSRQPAASPSPTPSRTPASSTVAIKPYITSFLKSEQIAENIHKITSFIEKKWVGKPTTYQDVPWNIRTNQNADPNFLNDNDVSAMSGSNGSIITIKPKNNVIKKNPIFLSLNNQFGEAYQQFGQEYFNIDGFNYHVTDIHGVIGWNDYITLYKTKIACIVDPISETFTIDKTLYEEGIFVTGIDLFFKSKSSTKPVTVELRQTVNGYPDSDYFISGSQIVVEPENIAISNDASLPTHISFDFPIFLSPGEFSVCLITDTTEYTAYIGNLGEYQLGTSSERITKNLYVGTFFKSANASTWLPQPNTDIKFVLYRAKFETNKPIKGTIYPKNDQREVIKFNSLCLNASLITPDKTKVNIPSHSFMTEENLTFEKTFSINFNETVELKNTFVINEI